MNRSILLGTFAFVVGCGATIPPPSERLASAEAASRSAREVGAENEPQAALHLKMANDQIDQARALMKAGENAAAANMLWRASADAELALEIAREASTRVRANEALAKVEAARKDQ